ncbi:MAG: helix-turn-helix domain-containing protein [Actinomycetota bacterium]|nr:MAG: helix-turn-helix domain-containing protein [Actinomycetota bacterium]
MAVKTLQSVESAFRVLELLAERQPAGVSALAREAGLDKNAVQRVLVTLGGLGWIRQVDDDSGAWELTGRAARVAAHYAPDWREAARPHLEGLQQSTGETVLMWRREGEQLVLVDAVDSVQPLRVTVPIGTELRLEADHELRRQLGAPAEPRRHWVVDQSYPNAVAVGAALFDRAGRGVGVLTVVGPRSRLPRADLKRLGALAAAAARAIDAAR